MCIACCALCIWVLRIDCASCILCLPCVVCTLYWIFAPRSCVSYAMYRVLCIVCCVSCPVCCVWRMVCRVWCAVRCVLFSVYVYTVRCALCVVCIEILVRCIAHCVLCTVGLIRTSDLIKHTPMTWRQDTRCQRNIQTTVDYYPQTCLRSTLLDHFFKFGGRFLRPEGSFLEPWGVIFGAKRALGVDLGT